MGTTLDQTPALYSQDQGATPAHITPLPLAPTGLSRMGPGCCLHEAHRHSGNKYLNVFCLDYVYVDIHFTTLLHYEALSAALNGAALRATSILLKIIH